MFDGLLPQALLQGLSLGAVYGLVALGLTLGYSATRVFNFAHGDLLMAAAFIGWWLVVDCGLAYSLAAALAIVLVAAIGWAVQVFAVRRVLDGPHVAGVVLTIAVGFMLRGAVSLLFGPESRTFESPWTGQRLSLGPLVLSQAHGVVLVVALLAAAALFALMRGTAFGVSIRAAAQNTRAARLCGVRVQTLNAWVAALAGAMAALSGLLLAPVTLIDLGLWTVLLKAMAALVLGGFGSAPGALLGGLLLGVLEQLGAAYLPDGFTDVVPPALLILVLLIWPGGLLGERRHVRA